MDFTGDEIDKAFPEVKPVSDSLELKKQMGLDKEKYTFKQINEIYNVATKKILECGSKVDGFEYIKKSNDLVSAKKDVKDKYKYLLNLLTNDYANILN